MPACVGAQPSSSRARLLTAEVERDPAHARAGLLRGRTSGESHHLLDAGHAEQPLDEAHSDVAGGSGDRDPHGRLLPGQGWAMSEYEDSQVLPLSGAAAFALVADVRRLPGWLDLVDTAEVPAPDLLRLTGSRGGVPYVLEVLWRARPEQLRVEWGSRGDGRYSGWAQVSDSGSDGSASEVVVHLSFLDEAAREGRAVGADAALRTALERLSVLAAQ